MPHLFNKSAAFLFTINNGLYFSMVTFNGSMNILIVERTGDFMRFSTITMEELERISENEKDIIIIDLRNHASFENCHFKGAVNIPFNQIDERIIELPKDKTLVFYCSRGGQSMLVCNELSGMGYKVVNIANGITFYNGKYRVRGRNCIDR